MPQKFKGELKVVLNIYLGIQLIWLGNCLGEVVSGGLPCFGQGQLILWNTDLHEGHLSRVKGLRVNMRWILTTLRLKCQISCWTWQLHIRYTHLFVYVCMHFCIYVHVYVFGSRTVLLYWRDIHVSDRW